MYSFGEIDSLERWALAFPGIGVYVPSRYGDTYECANSSYFYTPGEFFTRPGFSQKLAFLELFQMLAGTANLDLVKRAAPKADMSLFTPMAFYGPKFRPTFEGKIIPYFTSTANETGRRQAVIFIGDNESTCGNELPCTESLQFIERNGFLSLTVNMRSQDMLVGMLYDRVVFGGILIIASSMLGLKPGVVDVNVGSFHVYTKNLPAVPHALKRFSVIPVFDSFSLLDKWVVDQMQNLDNWKNSAPMGITVH